MKLGTLKRALGDSPSRAVYDTGSHQTPVNFYDAPQAGLGFLQSQTAHIEREVNHVAYPDIQYPKLIPVDTKAAPWATVVEYYSADKSGRAQWFNGRGQDIPNVAVQMEQHNIAVHMAAIGYDYTIQEINQASMAGLSLNSDKAMAARRAYEEFVDNIALFGDATKNFEGLTGHSGITPANVPNDGTGSSRLFTSKTPTQILRDLNEPLGDIWTTSKTVELANTLALPATTINYLATTSRSDNSDATIMDYFIKNNIYTMQTQRPLDIVLLRGLETAGVTATKRMIAYRRDPEVLKLHIPMPHRFLTPVTSNNILFEVPGIFRLGGLNIRRPGAVRYRDGF